MSGASAGEQIRSRPAHSANWGPKGIRTWLQFQTLEPRAQTRHCVKNPPGGTPGAACMGPPSACGLWRMPDVAGQLWIAPMPSYCCWSWSLVQIVGCGRYTALYAQQSMYATLCACRCATASTTHKAFGVWRQVQSSHHSSDAGMLLVAQPQGPAAPG
jgi:hypothetical protein